MNNKALDTNRNLLRLSATLLVMGILVSFLAGMYHPDHASANDHTAAFFEYANSDIWIGVHLGQFVGMAILIAGLLALYTTLDLPSKVQVGLEGLELFPA